VNACHVANPVRGCLVVFYTEAPLSLDLAYSLWNKVEKKNLGYREYKLGFLFTGLLVIVFSLKELQTNVAQHT
jgi:hypothetical protein